MAVKIRITRQTISEIIEQAVTNKDTIMFNWLQWTLQADAKGYIDLVLEYRDNKGRFIKK
jgi:ferritin